MSRYQEKPTEARDTKVRQSGVRVWGQVGVLLLATCAYMADADAGAGSDWLQGLNQGLINNEELTRCYDREKEAQTYNYIRCAEEHRWRQEELQNDRDRRNEERGRKQDEDQRELDELSRMPNVSDEMHARFGQVITFDECMSVYDESGLYGKRGFTRNDARSSCTTFVNNVRAYCLKSRDDQCAEKGYLRPDQTASALQQQQRDAAARQQEQERERRQALRDEWIRAGGTPGQCPSLQAAANMNHPCHY